MTGYGESVFSLDELRARTAAMLDRIEAEQTEAADRAAAAPKARRTHAGVPQSAAQRRARSEMQRQTMARITTARGASPLQLARIKRGWTEAHAAARIGISRRTWQSAAAGQPVTRRTRRKIKEVFPGIELEVNS